MDIDRNRFDNAKVIFLLELLMNRDTTKLIYV